MVNPPDEWMVLLYIIPTKKPEGNGKIAKKRKLWKGPVESFTTFAKGLAFEAILR